MPVAQVELIEVCLFIGAELRLAALSVAPRVVPPALALPVAAVAAFAPRADARFPLAPAAVALVGFEAMRVHLDAILGDHVVVQDEEV